MKIVKQFEDSSEEIIECAFYGRTFNINIIKKTVVVNEEDKGIIGWKAIEDVLFSFVNGGIITSETEFHGNIVDVVKSKKYLALFIIKIGTNEENDDVYIIVGLLDFSKELYRFEGKYYINDETNVLLTLNYGYIKCIELDTMTVNWKYCWLAEFEDIILTNHITEFNDICYVKDDNKIYFDRYVNTWYSKKIHKMLKFQDSLVIITTGKVSFFLIADKENTHLFDYLGIFEGADIVNTYLVLFTNIFFYVYDLSHNRIVNTFFTFFYFPKYLNKHLSPSMKKCKNVFIKKYKKPKTDLIQNEGTNYAEIFPIICEDENLIDEEYKGDIFIYKDLVFILSLENKILYCVYQLPYYKLYGKVSIIEKRSDKQITIKLTNKGRKGGGNDFIFHLYTKKIILNFNNSGVGNGVINYKKRINK